MAATLATLADVQARNPYREIDSGEQRPNASEVAKWLDEAETKVRNTLASVGITVEVAAWTQILGPIITNYAEGHLRQAYAAAGGDGQNDDGKDLLKQFQDDLKDIRDNPGDWSAILGGTTAPGTSGRLRGTATTNVVAPMFTTDAQEDQF